MTIKQEYKNLVIGFNHSALPLGERNDLHILYAIAKASHRQDYLDMFETTNESEETQINRFNERRSKKISSRKS